MAAAAVRILPRADADIDAAVDYYSEESGPELAMRFLRSVQHACDLLRSHPTAGSVACLARTDLRGIRRWPVPEFRAHLIFYRLVGDDVEIVRVLHGARDIERIFETDE